MKNFTIFTACTLLLACASAAEARGRLFFRPRACRGACGASSSVVQKGGPVQKASPVQADEPTQKDAVQKGTPAQKSYPQQHAEWKAAEGARRGIFGHFGSPAGRGWWGEGAGRGPTAAIALSRCCVMSRNCVASAAAYGPNGWYAIKLYR